MACAINTTHPNEAITKFLIDNCDAIKENSDCYNKSLKAINDANYTGKSNAWTGEAPGSPYDLIRNDSAARKAIGARFSSLEKAGFAGVKADYSAPDVMADYHTNLPPPVEDLSKPASYQQVLDNAQKIPFSEREKVEEHHEYGSAWVPGDKYIEGSPGRAWQKVKALQVMAKHFISEYSGTDENTLKLMKDWLNNVQPYLDNLWNLWTCGENLQEIAKEYKDLVKAEAEKGKERQKELTEKIKKCRDKANNQKLKAADCLDANELKELQAGVVLNQATKGTGALANVGAQVATAAEPTKRTFKEQCLLLSNIRQFTDYREQTVLKGAGKRLPYIDYKTDAGSIKANAALEVDRQPWGFINHLVQAPTFADLFSIKNHHLSQLQPMISLFKVISDASGKEIEIPVHFDSVYNSELDGVLRSSRKRGFGVGIQDFTFSYRGSDPFSVKKSIQAKLSIFASSLDDLLQPRGDYRYVDLALKTGTTQDNPRAERAKASFRLKAVVGWAKPTQLKGATDEETQRINTAIDNSFVTLQLTPTIHEFDIKEDGRVVFNVEYLAYVEHFFDQSSYNIFSEIEIQKRAFTRTQKITAMKADCSDTATEELKEYLEEEAEKIDDDKRAQLSAIINQLMAMKRVFFKPIPYESLNSFNLQGPYWKFDLYGDTQGAIAEAEKKKVASAVTKATSKKTDKSKTDTNLSETAVKDLNLKEFISFFYLGDLVDVILQNIEKTLEDIPKQIGTVTKPKSVNSNQWNTAVKKEKYNAKLMHTNFKQLRPLLGPIEILDTVSQEYKIVNLGDMPISVSYFMDWLTDKTLKRDNIEYSLPIFLKDLINNLVRNFLNEPKCFDINVNQRVSLFQSVVTSYNNSKTDRITALTLAQAGSMADKGYHRQGKLWLSDGYRTPVLNVMGERNSAITTRAPDKTFNYMVFYAGRTQPQDLMKGDSTTDQNAGIFHYVLGRDKGIIKNIQLTQTDSPGLREVRYEQEGYDGLQQLRPQFDATVTCYGSPNIVPGTYIFIDPEGFAPNARTVDFDKMKMTQLGIGGYYMVIESENSYGPGYCNTQFTAKWVAQIGTGGTNSTKKLRSVTTKCKGENN
jgi:hypothetical protein